MYCKSRRFTPPCSLANFLHDESVWSAAAFFLQIVSSKIKGGGGISGGGQKPSCVLWGPRLSDSVWQKVDNTAWTASVTNHSHFKYVREAFTWLFCLAWLAVALQDYIGFCSSNAFLYSWQVLLATLLFAWLFSLGAKINGSKQERKEGRRTLSRGNECIGHKPYGPECKI